MAPTSATGLSRLRAAVTPWRIAYTAAIGLAVLLAIVGFQRANTKPPVSCGTAPVIRLVPCPNDTALRQGLIGVDLAAGYQGTLSVDGVEIPPDELRTGGSSQLFYQPGPGTVTGALPPGRHTAVLRYWLTTSDPANSDEVDWNFTTA